MAAHAQSLKVSIASNDQNNSFCEGVFEDFILSANVSGGNEPYTYEWTYSFQDDTAQGRTIVVTPRESGVVKVKVTDNSHPAKSKEAIFRISEVSMEADFTFSQDSLCAQSPMKFTPIVSGGSPEYNYQWDFGDGYSSIEQNPVHEFVASGCTGFTEFWAYLYVRDRNGCSAFSDTSLFVKNK
jgi:PKD repeat protein